MMTEMSGGRKVHKARKPPTSVYLDSPPQAPREMDISYHAMNPDAVLETERKWRDRIVTSRILYKPGILAIARTNFHGTRWNLRHESDITKVVIFPSKHQIIRWEENLNPNWNFHQSRTDPEPSSLFVSDASYDFSAQHFEELRDEFLQHLMATATLSVEYNPVLKIDRKFDESPENFAIRCMEQAREDFNQEMHQLEDTLNRLSDRLKQRMERQTRAGAEVADLNSTRAGGDFDVQEEIEAHDSKTAMEDVRREMEKLDLVRETKLKEFDDRLETAASQRETEVFRLNSTQIRILRFDLIWLPYVEYILQEEDSRKVEIVQAF